MKKILIGIFTIFITVLIFVFSIVVNLETTVMDSVDVIVSKELTNNVVDIISKNTNVSKENVEEGIQKVLEKTDGVENIFHLYIEKVIDIVKGKEVEEIDVTKEIENILNQSEGILKEYDITITEEQKKELFTKVDELQMNKELNDTIKAFQGSVPREVKTAIEVYEFLRSTTFKMLLIGGVIILLVFIALLKKSTYMWLTNLGASMALNGLLIVLGISYMIKYLESMINIMEYVSFNSFINYGYWLIGLGFISFVVPIVISQFMKQKEEINF